MVANLLSSISLLLLLPLFSYYQRFIAHLCAMTYIDNMLFPPFISFFKLIMVTLRFPVNTWNIGSSCSSKTFKGFILIHVKIYLLVHSVFLIQLNLNQIWAIDSSIWKGNNDAKEQGGRKETFPTSFGGGKGF